LTTCNPRYSASSRLVVTAVLHTSVTAGTLGASSPPPAAKEKPPTSLAGETAPASGAVNTFEEVVKGTLWGVLAIGTFLLVPIGWRRFGHGWRWAAPAVGIPVAIVLLFICFQHVSLSLPETF
jgi:hypothetical protein